jgi:hypothetical protein
MGYKLFYAVVLLFMSVRGYSQDLKITLKDQSQNIFATDSVAKITFATDRTHALVVHQKDGSQLNAVLTDIDNLTFSRMTHVRETKFDGFSVDRTYILHQNYPNPFNGSTMIAYELPCPGWLNVQIYNISGQLLRTVESRFYESGTYRTHWNGENDAHQILANGLYVARVKFNDSVQVIKLLFVK